MNFFQKLLDKSGLSIIFQSRIDDEKERQQTIDWINHSLITVIDTVADDIETEKLGFYPHPENEQALNERADSLGYVQYVIKNKSGGRLELSQFSLVSCNSIKMTENYKKLKSLVNDAGYSIELKEINIDGDGVDTYAELDEYIDDFERYFIIIVSGW
jgi:hypothetical protein